VIFELSLSAIIVDLCLIFLIAAPPIIFSSGRRIRVAQFKTKAARNEVRKLLATFLNNLGIAFATIGFVVPVLSYSQSHPGLTPLSSIDYKLAIRYLAIVCTAISIGAMLHLYARLAIASYED
jgi:hypothetical protein